MAAGLWSVVAAETHLGASGQMAREAPALESSVQARRVLSIVTQAALVDMHAPVRSATTEQLMPVPVLWTASFSGPPSAGRIEFRDDADLRHGIALSLATGARILADVVSDIWLKDYPMHGATVDRTMNPLAAEPVKTREHYAMILPSTVSPRRSISVASSPRSLASEDPFGLSADGGVTP